MNKSELKKQKRRKEFKGDEPYDYSKPQKNYFATWNYWNELIKNNETNTTHTRL
jgi:hypothetical protein